MKLRVTNTDKAEDMSLDTVIMPISEFCDIHSHPYLASAGFDFIVVDLDAEIKPGYLRALLGKYLVIPRIVGDVTQDTVRLLTELYPEYAAKIRYTFIREKGNIGDVITELRNKFEWNKYY